MAKKYSHNDKIGNQLEIGDAVAFPHGNSLRIGVIKAMGEKMLRVKDVNSTAHLARQFRHRNANGNLKYSKDVVLVKGPELTAYLLMKDHTT